MPALTMVLIVCMGICLIFSVLVQPPQKGMPSWSEQSSHQWIGTAQVQPVWELGNSFIDLMPCSCLNLTKKTVSLQSAFK